MHLAWNLNRFHVFWPFCWASLHNLCLWIQTSQDVKHWEHYFNKFVIGTLDLKHWKHCVDIQAWSWETFCLQVQRCETDSNKFCRRETFAVSAGTCIPVKMKKKCRPQCLYMLKLAEMRFVKHFTRPDFRARNFTHYFYSQWNGANALISVIQVFFC